MLPTQEAFPYSIRVVSEITESNGSSSMASVCGASLALMDAGVRSRPVAGIAMGLVKEGEKFAVLTDILGDEDHLGDMDFKVAGTAKGVTALQMDIKINGITEEIMEIALEQALEARLNILGQMNQVISESRAELSENAPTMLAMKIDQGQDPRRDRQGGATIRGICEETKASIDIEDDGTIKIYGETREAAEAAKQRVLGITAEAEMGKIYVGKVERIVDFGAFVNNPAGQGRSGAHLADQRSAHREGHRRPQGRSGSEGAGAGRGQPRSHQAVDQGRGGGGSLRRLRRPRMRKTRLRPGFFVSGTGAGNFISRPYRCAVATASKGGNCPIAIGIHP